MNPLQIHFLNLFPAVKDAGFNPVLEYAGDDASYHSDPGKSSTSGSGQQTLASEDIQPLWTAQLRASLTQIYEKCSVQVPTPLQRSSHLRPLLAASASELETPAAPAVMASTAVKSEQGPQNSSESDLSNNVA